MDLDILYSLTCHESPDALADTLENIKYFNRGHRIGIILNTNPDMYLSMKEDDVVRIVPTPWAKRSESCDIFHAHLQNYNYACENNIRATYFIMLASNCMFHRAVTLQEIETGLASTPACDVQTYHERENGWHWPHFYKNTDLLSRMSEGGIKSYIGYQHEGMVIPHAIMENIYTFVMGQRIFEQITYNTIFEEILPATLFAYSTGKKPFCICKVFWDKKEYTPSIEDIRECSAPCVKRVARSMNDPVREWLKTLRT